MNGVLAIRVNRSIRVNVFGCEQFLLFNSYYQYSMLIIDYLFMLLIFYPTALWRSSFLAAPHKSRPPFYDISEEQRLFPGRRGHSL